MVLQGFSPEGDHGGRNPSVTAAQPLAALLPYGCGVPLAGAALLGMTEKGLTTRWDEVGVNSSLITPNLSLKFDD